LKILAPVSSAREARHLISCGAGELYCGLHPGIRPGESGKLWVNRRGPGPANISSGEEIKRLTEYAGRQGVPVYLTLNLPFYPPAQYPEIVGLAEEAASSWGIKAFIVGDPGMITALREKIPGVSIHVSSLLAVLNSASASLFRDLGGSRIIFPRYMGLEELGEIVSRVGPETEYEVFMLNDGCVFEEGYCQASHAFGGAFCHQPWQYRPIYIPGLPERQPREPFWQHLGDYRRWLWYIKNCGGMRGPGGAPLGMCGLCAIPNLQAMGVASLKIVGRESPLQKKMASVKLIKEALRIADSLSNEDTVRERIKKLRGTPGLCDSGYMCYFR